MRNGKEGVEGTSQTSNAFLTDVEVLGAEVHELERWS
jgi:hypothetical protein